MMILMLVGLAYNIGKRERERYRVVDGSLVETVWRGT